MTLVLTGVGARKTPPEVLEQMRQIGQWCRENRVVVRSGHAEGADWAFEQGAQEFCLAYVPWPSFNEDLRSDARRVVYQETEASRALVSEIHPAPDRLTQGTWKLHGRNTWQVLGSKLDRPSDLLVCWTPGGKVVGGTATAIRLAEKCDVPVFNLAIHPPEEVYEFLDG